MFATFFIHKYFMTGIIILLLLSIICQLIIGVLYQKLILETDNLSSTQNKSLQQLKLRYSSHTLMGEGVTNVPIFVDRFLNKLKIGYFSLNFLKHLSGQLVLLAVLTAGIGSCRSIVRGENFLHIVPFYMIVFLGLYLYFAVCALVDLPGKNQILRTNLIDYLENHLTSRIEQSAADSRELNRKLNRESDGNFTKDSNSKLNENNDLNIETKDSVNKNSPAFSQTEAEELEKLLKELII